MKAHELIHAGDYLAGLRFGQRQIDAIPASIRPMDLTAAYAMQEVVVNRLVARQGGRRIGYKISLYQPRRARDVACRWAALWATAFLLEPCGPGDLAAGGFYPMCDRSRIWLSLGY